MQCAGWGFACSPDHLKSFGVNLLDSHVCIHQALSMWHGTIMFLSVSSLKHPRGEASMCYNTLTWKEWISLQQNVLIFLIRTEDPQEACLLQKQSSCFFQRFMILLQFNFPHYHGSPGNCNPAWVRKITFSFSRPSQVFFNVLCVL